MQVDAVRVRRWAALTGCCLVLTSGVLLGGPSAPGSGTAARAASAVVPTDGPTTVELPSPVTPTAGPTDAPTDVPGTPDPTPDGTPDGTAPAAPPTAPGPAPGGAGTSPAASAPPSSRPSDRASDGPGERPDLTASQSQTELRAGWIEPAWLVLVLVLVLVPVLAAPLLFLSLRGAFTHGQHRRR